LGLAIVHVHSRLGTSKVETSTVEVGMEYREPEMTFVQFYLYRYSTNTHLSNTQDSAPSVRKNGIF